MVELKGILDGLGPGGGNHPRRACNLLSSTRFGRYLKKLKSGRISLDKAKIREEARFDGKFVITTNDPQLTAVEAGLGYKNLLIIESCFRRMKTTGLKLRPVYHWNRRRIEAHVKLCVLALLLNMPPSSDAKNHRGKFSELSGIKAVEYQTKNVSIVQRTKLQKPQREILKKPRCTKA